MTELADHELLERWRRGREAAFEELVHRHGAAIKGFALRMLHDAALAEEVYADTFVRVATSKGEWDTRGTVRGWLFAIARNLCLDHLRHRAVRRRTEPRVIEVEQYRVPTPNPEAAVALGQQARALEAALARLPDEHREALLLRTVHGLSAAEAAQALRVRPEQVDSLVSYARKRLRALMEADAWREVG